MENFEFYNPVKILFGKGQIEKLNTLISKDKKILMIYGGGSIFKNGMYELVLKALKGFQLTEFGGIEANPTHETSMEAVKLIKEKNIDFILAVGGGSVIDATKYIAASVYFDNKDPWQILSEGADIEKALPFGTILTLPATGTEMNANSVISKKSTQEKLAFSSEKIMPVFSILDPTTAGSLPKEQVANGVVDAFVHVVEQYLTYLASAPLQDRMAESILKTLIEIGPAVFRNPHDYDAMANLMWCATMALNGVISVGVPQDWATHSIGHELTAYHNIDHARTLAIVLPGLLLVLRKEKREKLLQYADRIWDIKLGSEDEKIEKAVGKTISFFESLGIQTRLSNYGVLTGTIDLIVKRFRDRKWLGLGDRQLVTPEKVKEILMHQL